MEQKSQEKQFVICISNEGYPASLEVRKIYEVVADGSAGEHGLIRVIDESGEDYLYPHNHFISIDLPQSIEKALTVAP
jgi:hypothetical protein